MNNLRDSLLNTIRFFAAVEGFNATPVPRVYCLKFSHPERFSKRRLRARLAIMAQASKDIVLERDVSHCDDKQYIAALVDLPVVSRITSASPQKPFLAMLIDLNPIILSEISAQLSEDNNGESGKSLRAIFIGETKAEMLETAVRLGKLFHTPEDARVVGPLVVREMIYHLLKGSDGNAIRRFVRSGAKPTLSPNASMDFNRSLTMTLMFR